ncbi:unnamed protein product [Sphagnum troendelagicum]|uniref:Uncharacterized protein n=1 Tax=Sphagnum troendelagicum TaxID=128251 RepID=A0ABP0TVW9_9BRYO
MVKEERRRRGRGPNRDLKIVVVPKAFEDLDAGGGKKAKAEEDTQEDDDDRGGDGGSRVPLVSHPLFLIDLGFHFGYPWTCSLDLYM